VVESQLTAELIINSYNIIGCDGFNIGAYDLALGIDFLMEMRRRANFPFLSANLTDAHDKLLFDPYIVLNVNGLRVAVFGLIDSGIKADRIPGGHKLAVRDPYDVARELVPRLRKEEKADFVILLTDMVGVQCRRLAQLELPINLVIGSSKRNRISLPMIANDLYITHLDRGGKSVGLLTIRTLGGRGAEAIPEADRIKGRVVGDIFYLNQFVQLRIELADHPKIGSMVDAHVEKIKRLQQVKATTTLSVPLATGKATRSTSENPFVGASVCSGCHKLQYERWQRTAHARAYIALVERKQQYDVDCIGCHTLGYEQEGGFFDLNRVGFHAGVQCESCHGPGHLHVAGKGDTAKIVRRRDEQICLQCHIPEKSPEFDFMTYFDRICGPVH
jgi:hypothetical protein